MKTFAAILTAVLVASMAGTASAQSTVRCESPDGRRRECRVEGTGTVQISQQLSGTACVLGQSWGVTGNTIWVDRGCRADFILVAGGDRNRGGWGGDDQNRGGWANDDRNRPGWNERGRGEGERRRGESRTTTVVCESRDGRRHRCAADTLGQITLGRQFGRSDRCVEGRTWGVDREAIWVDRGCRAEFLIADNGGTYRDRDRGSGRAMQTLVCESDSRARSYCRANTSFGVRLVREFSRNNCFANRTWGSDRNGVWVSDGCRAEFALMPRP